MAQPRRSVLEGRSQRETMTISRRTAAAYRHIVRLADHAAALRALRVPLSREGIVAEGDSDGKVEEALGRRSYRRKPARSASEVFSVTCVSLSDRPSVG